ncbi:MAG: hypothetical protein WA790_06430 [Sulfitobacter sp.]
MNTQAPIGKDDNVDKKFNDFSPYLDEITIHVLEAQKHLDRHNRSVFEALGRTLDLGYLFEEKRKADGDDNREFLKDFLEAHGERWSTKCEISFFHGLVGVAFGQIDSKTDEPLNSAPTLSRYRAVLRYAFEGKLTGEELVAKLKAMTLNNYYSEAVSHFRYDPLDRYVEDDDDRFLRSVRHLYRTMNLPKIAYSEDFTKPKSVGGFATALVRVRNGSMQLVGFTEDGDEESVRAKVSALVPAEAKRRRKKLSDKNLYWLYVTCDLYRRFLPNIADRRAWAKASKEADIPIIDANSTDDEINRSIQRRIEIGEEQTKQKERILEAIDAEKTPDALMKKFASLDALEFVRHDGHWIARTLTTHPNTPCITVSQPDGKARTMLPPRLGILGIEAKRFVGEFPKFKDWRFARKGKMGTLVDAEGKTASTKFQDLQGLALWRTTDPQLTPVARYKLDRSQLHDLERWRAEYADIPRIGRKAFQSVMKLDIVAGDLKLIHPLDEDHQKTLGVSKTGPLPALNETRFFDFKICEKLIELALDYGIGFEFDLMEGHQGTSALRVHPIDFPIEASVVLPLMLSNKGNPVEITASAR